MAKKKSGRTAVRRSETSVEALRQDILDHLFYRQARFPAVATSNDIGNARFVRADLAEAGAAFAREHWDLVLLDPPRSGASQVVADIQRMAPRAIAYVSCHPATLARDAGSLVHEAGYRLTAAGVFDMFPHTHHVEVMALFERC